PLSALESLPTRRSSDLAVPVDVDAGFPGGVDLVVQPFAFQRVAAVAGLAEHRLADDAVGDELAGGDELGAHHLLRADLHDDVRVDRKSTRLNSSHVKTS